MSAAQKVERIRELCRHANRLALAGLRLRHPAEDEESLRRRLAAIRLGEDVMRRIYPVRDV
jgi:hypothetical protein